MIDEVCKLKMLWPVQRLETDCSEGRLLQASFELLWRCKDVIFIKQRRIYILVLAKLVRRIIVGLCGGLRVITLRRETWTSTSQVARCTSHGRDGLSSVVDLLPARVDSEGDSDANDGSESGPELELQIAQAGEFGKRCDGSVLNRDAVDRKERVVWMQSVGMDSGYGVNDDVNANVEPGPLAHDEQGAYGSHGAAWNVDENVGAAAGVEVDGGFKQREVAGFVQMQTAGFSRETDLRRGEREARKGSLLVGRGPLVPWSGGLKFGRGVRVCTVGCEEELDRPVCGAAQGGGRVWRGAAQAQLVAVGC